MIDIESVTAAYGNGAGPLALDGVTLRVPPRETMVLLGGSGAGKSTVLKAILRLIDLQSGTIRIDGTDITSVERTALRRNVGMVFQESALFPHLTVAENIALPLRAAGMSHTQREARARELLELVGLAPAQYAGRYPNMLSGGQQQRVGVARALAPKPDYLLMDEPFGALDALTRRHLQDELKLLRSKLNITILFVTHDVMEAATLGDSIAVMDQGRVVQSGSAAELMDNPQHDVVRDLVSHPLQELRGFVKASVR